MINAGSMTDQMYKLSSGVYENQKKLIIKFHDFVAPPFVHFRSIF
jgi:hypothetical protein